MPDCICALVCRHYRAEALAACAQSELRGVRVDAFPSRCGRPGVSWNELEALRATPDEPLVVFGGACLAKLDQAEALARGIDLHLFNVCQEMLVNPKLVEEFLAQGAYLVTQGWLKDWRAHLAQQGQHPKDVRDFWRESMTRLLLLDSGVGDPCEEFLVFADYLGMPGVVLPLGLDHLRLLLERDILGARLRIQKIRSEGNLGQAQREAADRATAIDFLAALSQSLHGEQVIQGIIDLFTMLFHAERVTVLAMDDRTNGIPEMGDRPYVETQTGFMVPLATSVGFAGILKVEGLNHPQFKTHYLNLAISMAGVCALAIQNARIYRMAEDSRLYQRLILNVLDVYYQPAGSIKDTQKVLDYIQSFTGVDALALRLRQQGQFVYAESRGYPEGFTDTDCRRCLDGLLGNLEGIPSEATRSARGSFWINSLLQGELICPCALAGYQSMAMVPIRLSDGNFGVIQLHSNHLDKFTAPLIEQLEGVAQSIGIGLERRWAEQELRAANRELESRVQQRTRELATMNQELRLEIQERTRAESHLESQSAELQVRLKELHCLYDLSNLFEMPSETVDGLCLEAIRMMPQGWSDPEKTWARLRINEKVFESPDFHETTSCLAEPVIVNGRLRGWLEIFVEPVPGAFAFISEEKELIKTMRDLVQGLIDHIEVALEKQKVEDQMLQSQKLEALGTLAGGIAHDFNNALTPILALAELSLMKLPQDSPVRRHLDVIKQSGDRAKGLVDQILLFSRKKELSRQPVALMPLLDEVMRLIRATLPSTIEIKQDHALSDANVMGDQTQIHQIIMNLCTNAYHAMQDTGGVLTVCLRQAYVAEGDSLNLLGLAPGNYAQIEVSDTGQGMSPEVRARIFEPFFTTKAPGKGTGMGLSVVHGIVMSYRGHISVYSEPHRGTTFQIHLPLLMTDVVVQTETGSLLDVPTGHERILIVDDEEAIRWSLNAMLQNLGYQTATAEDALEALERLHSEPGGFDLVFTDTTMPKMTGLELANQIRESKQNVRVVLCSGFSDRLTPERLQAAGIHEFVQKPFTVVELAQTIRRELDRPA